MALPLTLQMNELVDGRTICIAPPIQMTDLLEPTLAELQAQYPIAAHLYSHKHANQEIIY